MRTLIDLPDSQIQALAALCERVKQPPAAIIREAVAEFPERHAVQPTDAAYGLSGDRGAGWLGLPGKGPRRRSGCSDAVSRLSP